MPSTEMVVETNQRGGDSGVKLTALAGCQKEIAFLDFQGLTALPSEVINNHSKWQIEVRNMAWGKPGIQSQLKKF